MKKLITILLLIFYGSQAMAATIWVNPAGSATSPYDTKATGLTNIQAGLAQMSGGDELVVADGNYTGATNMIDSSEEDVPDGNYGADTTHRTSDDVWTTIRAESTMGVIVDGEYTHDNPLKLTNDNYIIIQDIEFRRPGDAEAQQEGVPVWANASHNIKFIRVGANNAVDQADDATWGDMSQTAQVGNCTYVLFEDCYASGWGKYVFLAYLSNYVVFRRCVSRYDGHTWGLSSNYQTYSSDYVVYQNCIAIDNNTDHAHWGTYSMGGFGTNGSSDNTTYRGCIVINMTGQDGVSGQYCNENSLSYDFRPGFFLNAGADSTTMTDNVVINSMIGVMTYGAATINRLSVIDMNLDATASYDGRGIQNISGSDPIITNSIFYDCADYGTCGINQSSSDYNAYYSNNTNYSCGDSSRTNDVSYDVTANGLLYPVRIESGSDLKTDGSSGGQIGAQIVNRWGTSGTLYGQSGWDTETSEDLWPWPHEETIRERMRSAPAHDDPCNGVVDTDRGFCATGQTLTKYIWEYLGNTIPDEIYGTTPTFGPGISGNFSCCQ